MNEDERGITPANVAACGATIQYTGGPKYTCTLAAGHKGPHFAAEGPVNWTWNI